MINVRVQAIATEKIESNSQKTREKMKLKDHTVSEPFSSMHQRTKIRSDPCAFLLTEFVE